MLATLEPPLERLGVTHWSSRLLTAELGASKVKIADVWRGWGCGGGELQVLRLALATPGSDHADGCALHEPTP